MNHRYLATLVLLLLACLQGVSSAASDGQKTYPEVLASIEDGRKQFAARWTTANENDRAAILAEARVFLEKSIVQDVFPRWFGTAWEFNGTTEKPGQGAIACGYFVTTVLRDAGFRIERVKLAQQASQVIIRTMTTKDQIKVTSNSSIENMEQVFKNRGDGLYVVGLDNHVGFVSVKGDTMTFVHSSYYPPRVVCAEPIQGNNPFSASSYRMIGKILGNESLVRWIKGEKIAMQR